jgi:hypothetical protein
MANKISIEYFGMPGTGRTVTEAKQDAGRNIEAALSGDYTPAVLTFRGTVALIARDPKTGWGYRFVHSEKGEMLQRMYLNCGYTDYEDCLLHAVRHIADNERKTGERDSELFNVLRPRIASEVRREFAQKAEYDDVFQARYREAQGRGMSDGEAYAYAHRDPSRRDLWETAA